MSQIRSSTPWRAPKTPTRTVPSELHGSVAQRRADGTDFGQPETSDPGLCDTRGRRLRDLRISVIDRCNFRCIYCMPKDVFGRNYAFLPRSELLSFEEIERVAQAAVDLGIAKIRLTGGEPLLRRQIEHLIERLARLPVELTLTTNGVLLKAKAKALKNAGLQRVTVSLDGIIDAAFRRMTDSNFGPQVIVEAIEEAAAVGLKPVKINCVIKRGVNDDQILPLVRRFRGTGHILRFIEYMDAGNSHGWRWEQVVPAREILSTIDAVFPLRPLEPRHPGEVAERWSYVDGSGEIGIIASVTQAFCRDCNRLRLSTDGKLFTCLFSHQGHDLRALLRSGADRATLRNTIANIWQARADRYSELRHTLSPASFPKIEMSYIGG